MATVATPDTRGTAGTSDVKGRLSLGSFLMMAAGLTYVVFGLMFLVRAFSDAYLEIGIGRNEVSRNRDEIEAFSDSLLQYIVHLHVAVAGFVVATGLWIAGLAWFGIRRGVFWAWHMAVWPPLAALAIAMPMHYPNHFDTARHLGMIYAASALFFAGALLSLQALLVKHREGTTCKC
jgi:hypothetical protein